LQCTEITPQLLESTQLHNTFKRKGLRKHLTVPFSSAGLTITKFIKPVESHDVPRELQFHTLHSLWTLVARTWINRAECVWDGQTVYSYVAENKTICSEAIRTGTILNQVR
jgi:hypothetical protein